MSTNAYTQTITPTTFWGYTAGVAHSVAISSANKFIGFPTEYYNTGEVFALANSAILNNDLYFSLMGFSVAMNNTYGVVSAPGNGTTNPAPYNFHRVYIVPPVYNNQLFPQQHNSPQFPQPSGLTYNARFGYSVGISRTGTDRIIAGAPGQQGKGAAYIAELANNSWIAVASLDNPAGVSNDQMGLSVAIEGDFAAVGAPGRNGGKGEVYIYQKSASNNSWSLALTYSNPTATADSLGVSLEMSGSFLFMGAPKADAGKGKVYWIDLSTVSTPTVTATQGTINGQTRIDWVPGASAGAVTGFKIYRDGSLLQSVGANDVYFYDANGVPGKHYIYEVCSYTAVGENNRKAAEGWSKGDGYMEGKVVTLVGNGGVGGVTIEAVATIEGNDYIYNATTDANGNYAIPNVYYGDAITNFSLSADFGDHVFVNNPIYTTLSPQQKTRSYLIFSDKTAYTISGIVGRRDVSCPLDSIHVYGEYVMEDSSTESLPQDAYTSNGAYSLNIDPYKQNVIGLRIKIDSTRILITSSGSDTLHYQFQALNTTNFTSLAGIGQNTTLNFEDTLSYPIRLEVFTACRNAVTGGQFKIRVRSKDDCFDKL